VGLDSTVLQNRARPVRTAESCPWHASSDPELDCASIEQSRVAVFRVLCLYFVRTVAIVARPSPHYQTASRNLCVRPVLLTDFGSFVFAVHVICCSQHLTGFHRQ
jgi:hypothetical protein